MGVGSGGQGGLALDFHMWYKHIDRGLKVLFFRFFFFLSPPPPPPENFLPTPLVLSYSLKNWGITTDFPAIPCVSMVRSVLFYFFYFIFMFYFIFVFFFIFVFHFSKCFIFVLTNCIIFVFISLRLFIQHNTILCFYIFQKDSTSSIKYTRTHTHSSCLDRRRISRKKFFFCFISLL